MWLWIAIEIESKEIVGCSISKARNMLIADRFISKLVKAYGPHPVSTDGGTWYPQASGFLGLNIIFTRLMRKALSKGRCSTSRTRLKILTIIFLVEKGRTAN